jgi:geranylgeranyl diphosphate synthase type II
VVDEDDDERRLEAYFAERRHLVDAALRAALPAPERWPATLFAAMEWALWGGGKRLRPVMTMAAFEAVGGHRDRPYEAVLPAACALEMLHTYSLVHDDLPAMDDDRMRRGRETVHVRFGEGAAILAGDALLTEAFRLILDPGAYGGFFDGERAARAGLQLARAAGWRGMVGGQSLDLGLEQPIATEADLTFLHRRKTGDLFRFAAWVGGLFGGASEGVLTALAAYGETVGLAFQVWDDVLDAMQDQGPRAADAQETPSFPATLGLDGSHQRAEALADRAIGTLSGFGDDAEPLRRIARYAVSRRV